jgi:hypothetical protein
MSYPFGIMTPIKNTGTKHRGLAPHNNTPMLGVRERELPMTRYREFRIKGGRPLTAVVRPKDNLP